MEQLEGRSMLATYTWDSGAGTLSISLGTNESLTTSEAAGTRSFALSGGAFAQSGGNTATGDGTATLTFTGAQNIGSSIAINNTGAGAGTNNVTFASGTISSALLTVDTFSNVLASGAITDNPAAVLS